MPFDVVPASALRPTRASYPPHGWPLAELHPGQAFVIPMNGDRDADGRPSQYVRLTVHQTGKRLDRRFSVNKLKSGDLAVTRTA